MPRNPSGVYSLPPGVIVAVGDQILPEQHNPALTDLAADANAPRPVNAGGTGATSATEARANLGAVSLTGDQTISGGKTFSGPAVFSSTVAVTGAVTAATATFSGNVTVSAALTATSVAGDGASLTNLAAGALTGAIAFARLPAASQAQAEAGTAADVVMTPQRVAQAVTAQVPLQIGVGQTWQNVGGARVPDGTSYQNTTGRPIMVAVTRGLADGETVGQASVDNSTWVTVARCGNFQAISFIVPPGHYYRVTGGNLSFWSELRA
jgi:hypothetical protein